MSTYTAREDSHVFKVINLLQNYKFEWAIAGGWCRDMIQRKQPKDLDIIICNVDYISKGAMRDFEAELKALGSSREEFDASGGQELSKVIAAGDEVPIDLIFWKGKYKTIESIVSRFDTNMNQFILNKEGDIKFLGENRGVMHLIKSSRSGSMTQERFERMLVVANKLGWDLSKEVETLALEGLPKNRDNDCFGDLGVSVAP